MNVEVELSPDLKLVCQYDSKDRATHRFVLVDKLYLTEIILTPREASALIGAIRTIRDTELGGI